MVGQGARPTKVTYRGRRRPPEADQPHKIDFSKTSKKPDLKVKR